MYVAPVENDIPGHAGVRGKHARIADVDEIKYEVPRYRSDFNADQSVVVRLCSGSDRRCRCRCANDDFWYIDGVGWTNTAAGWGQVCISAGSDINPACASCKAMALPIPRLEPVTKIRLLTLYP